MEECVEIFTIVNRNALFANNIGQTFTVQNLESWTNQGFGYSFAAAGENIAHHATVEKSQAALISSPGHRANILSRSFTRVGIGIVQDKNGYVYLTQIFCR